MIGNRRHEGGGVRAVDAERFKLGRNNAHDIDAPAGDGNQNTDWRGGGVQNIGQLCPGCLEAVKDGAEHGPQNEAVARVGKEDDQPAQPGRQLRFYFAVDAVCHGLCKCPCPAGFLDQGYKAAHGRHHYDRLGIVVCRQIDKQIVAEQVLQGEPGVGALLDHDAEEQADCQGEHYVAGGKGQHDCYNSRNERQPAIVDDFFHKNLLFFTYDGSGFHNAPGYLLLSFNSANRVPNKFTLSGKLTASFSY